METQSYSSSDERPKAKPDTVARLADLRNVMEAKYVLDGPLSYGAKHMVDVAARNFGPPVKLIQSAGLDTSHFRMTEYVEGLWESLAELPVSAGISIAELTYALTAFENEGWDALGARPLQAWQDPTDFKERTSATMHYVMEDYMQYSHLTDHKDISYHMGKMAGTVIGMILLKRGLGTVPAAFNTARKTGNVVFPEAQALSSIAMLNFGADIATALIPEDLETPQDPKAKWAVKLIKRLRHRLGYVDNPVVLESMGNAIHELYLVSKNPKKFPLSEQTLDFLRTELVAEYRYFGITRELNTKNYSYAIEGMLHVMYEHSPTLLSQLPQEDAKAILNADPGAELIIEEMEIADQHKLGLRVVLTGIRKDLDANHAPQPSLVNRFFEIIQSVYLESTQPEKYEKPAAPINKADTLLLADALKKDDVGAI